MSVNIPLLREAVEWVETQAALRAVGKDSFWCQGSYVTIDADHLNHCGTAYCVAGWVGMRTKPQWFKRFDEIHIEDKDDPDYDPQFSHLFDGYGDLHVADFAQYVLGLSSEQAEALFDGGNSVSDIRRIAEEIAGHPL